MERKGRKRDRASSSIHKRVVACPPHRRDTPSLYTNYVGLPTRATPILARSLPPILPTLTALSHIPTLRSSIASCYIHRFASRPSCVPLAFPDTPPSRIPLVSVIPGRMCAVVLADGGWAQGPDGAAALSPCGGAAASASREGATASLPCKDMIPPASQEGAAVSVLPPPATFKSARVRVSHARGAEVSGLR